MTDLEEYARLAWSILYSDQQQKELEKAASFINQARRQVPLGDDLKELYHEIYVKPDKDFDKIRKSTEELDIKYRHTIKGEQSYHE